MSNQDLTKRELTNLITVRDTESILQWNVDDWSSYVILAALSANPVTAEELLAAVARYQRESLWSGTVREVNDMSQAAAADRPWCFIDLRGRTVLTGGGFDLPDTSGIYAPSPNEPHEGFAIVWMDTSSDWLWDEAKDDWKLVLARRIAQANQHPPIDTRHVLFGLPLLRYISQRTFAAICPDESTSAQTPTDNTSADESQLIRTIHADWLLTSRADLGNCSPRQVLLRDRIQIDSDMSHRAAQWSRQGFPPPPLPKSSLAYRFSGYGTIQIILYFKLVRFLILASQELIQHEGTLLEVTLVERLADLRDHWLERNYDDYDHHDYGNDFLAEKCRHHDTDGVNMNDDSDCDNEEARGLTHAAIIAHERARMPVTDDSSTEDCACPICRAQADGLFGHGPSFIWFNRFMLNLENNFAFSLAETHEQWEEERLTFAATEYAVGFGKLPDVDNDPADNKTLAGLNCRETQRFRDKTSSKTPQSDEIGPNSKTNRSLMSVVQNGRLTDDRVNDDLDEGFLSGQKTWKGSYVNWEVVIGPDGSPAFAKAAIGFPLAEIVTELQQLLASQTHVDSLNQAYTMFRHADVPIDQIIAAQHLCDALEEVAAIYPALVGRSADLQSHVDEVTRFLNDER